MSNRIGFHPGSLKVLAALVGLFLGITACAPAASNNSDATLVFEGALLTATFAVHEPSPSFTSTQIPSPTVTPTPSPTLTASPSEYSGPPPVLPDAFTTDLIRPGTNPVAYVQDTCEYLKNRLDPNKSAPGTVVMPVMFHGITEDTQVISNPMDVHHEDMVKFIERAVELGFETITTRELVDFLENNAPIPPLSLLIIVDDRRPGAVREHFMPYLEQYGWTLTLGWLIGDTDIRPASRLGCCPTEPYTTLWEQMEAYNATGLLDVQSHGNVHNINITEGSSDEYIISELSESRRIIQEHFYCKDYDTGQQIENCQTDQPLAFIWPGGGFTQRAAELAHENSYQIAFTTNPRGPIMYNWIPQAEDFDASTPSWIPEGPVGDPLMTLPRYWSYDAVYRLNDVFTIAQKAIQNAAETRQSEMDYYQVNCKESYGDIPALESAE